MNIEQMKQIIEAALLVSGEPLSIERLQALFPVEQPNAKEIREILQALTNDCTQRCYELKETASGYRLQVRAEFTPWIQKLWEERPPRYSRALLETLALIAYRQPITRAEIEEVRGVTVSSHIVKTLLEREWIKVIGQREVPGRPSLYATTKQFLDYFNLQSLDQLPTLPEIQALENVATQALENLQQAAELQQLTLAVAEESVETTTEDTVN
jgi:segregation and condensation protein B